MELICWQSAQAKRSEDVAVEFDLVAIVRKIADCIGIRGRKRDVENKVVRASLSRERILARPTDERVTTAAAVQRVIAGESAKMVCTSVSGDCIGERIAGSVKRSCTRELQLLDLRAKCIASRDYDGVGPAPGRFRYGVACAKILGVIAAKAGEMIGGGVASKHIR